MKKRLTSRKQSAAAQYDPEDKETLRWLPPVEGEWQTSTWHQWSTACGRYRAMRLVSKFGDTNRFVWEFRKTTPQHDGYVHVSWDYVPSKAATRSGQLKPQEYKTLADVLESIEKFHCTRYDLDAVNSNAFETVLEARKSGISEFSELRSQPHDNTKTPDRCNPNQRRTAMAETATENVLKISKAEAVALLQEVGWTAADNWKESKIVSVLNTKIKDLPEDAAPESPECKKLLKKILITLADESGKVEVSESGVPKKSKKEKVEPATTEASSDASANGKGTAPKKSKGDKDKTTAGKKESAKASEAGGKKAKERSSTERDKFGSRLGSAVSKINSVVTKKWQSMSELVTAAGLSGTFYDHMKKLVDGKFVEKSENGYRLV